MRFQAVFVEGCFFFSTRRVKALRRLLCGEAQMVKQQRIWTAKRDEKRRRLERITPLMRGRFLAEKDIMAAMYGLICPGDVVVMESGQKQADFLSEALAQADPERLHDLHLVIHALARPDHMELFRGASRPRWISATRGRRGGGWPRWCGTAA